MSFESQLGRSDSQLGNIQLGVVSGLSNDLNVSLAFASANTFSTTNGNVILASVSFSETASFSLTVVNTAVASLTFTGTNSYTTDTPGSTYKVTLSFSETASYSAIANEDLYVPNASDGFFGGFVFIGLNSFAASIINKAAASLSFTETANYTLANVIDFVVSNSFSSTNSFSALSNVDFESTLAFTETADYSITLGTNIPVSLAFNETNSFATTEFINFNLSLSLSETGGFILVNGTNFQSTLTFNETASFTLIPGGDQEANLSFTAVSTYSITVNLIISIGNTYTSHPLYGLGSEITGDDVDFAINLSLDVSKLTNRFGNIRSRLSNLRLGKQDVIYRNYSLVSFQAGLSYTNSVALSETAGLTFLDGLSYLNAPQSDFASTAGFGTPTSGYQIGNPPDTLGATAAATFGDSVTFKRSASNQLVLIQGVSRVFDRVPSGTTNALTIHQSAMWVREVAVAASNTITFTQEAQRIYTDASNNAIVFSQNAGFQRIINQHASNVLVLTQNISRNITFGLNASNTLAFINKAIGTLVPPKCFVTLRCKGDVITLRCPNLGDTQALTGINLLLRNAVDGTQYSYIRKTRNQTLKYTFSMIRAKSLELQVFLQKHIGDHITLQNWKGEIWDVIISNSPIEMIAKGRWAPCREQIDVTFDFEGVKLSG